LRARHEARPSHTTTHRGFSANGQTNRSPAPPSTENRCWSAQDTRHDVHRVADADQLLVQTAVLEGELKGVESEQMQNGRVQIADVHRVFHDIVAEVVGLTVDDTGANPGPGDPPA